MCYFKILQTNVVHSSVATLILLRINWRKTRKTKCFFIRALEGFAVLVNYLQK